LDGEPLDAAAVGGHVYGTIGIVAVDDGGGGVFADNIQCFINGDVFVVRRRVVVDINGVTVYGGVDGGLYGRVVAGSVPADVQDRPGGCGGALGWDDDAAGDQ